METLAWVAIGVAWGVAIGMFLAHHVVKKVVDR